MTAQEARELTEGTPVMWDNNPHDTGTVAEVGPGGIFVKWDNGDAGWVHFYDAGQIEKQEDGK